MPKTNNSAQPAVPDERSLAVMTAMLGGGNRRWAVSLLRHYAPVKQEQELVAILRALLQLGLVNQDERGLYGLTDAGRDAIQRAMA